ncbi:hypothetical protein [Rubellimicrobium sp. CFH 75288]|uniref:hypothetical protein n=1 Tax=Rubellimicrobium sp. CFH 75288 TaxID=2697034 RepID=UPI0014133546|nr:hypothetical protein [Rubellimicrobium sp. CFH 75288]NAZ35511.1 hypothetical protein [Rubellimicrobium sp. CFH 75288]
MRKADASKRSDFLWIVQSTYLANGINMAAQDAYRDQRRHEYSGLGVKNEMCDAIKASYLIPADLDAVTAADEYLTWKLFAQRDLEVPNPEEGRGQQPRWVTPGFAGWDKSQE